MPNQIRKYVLLTGADLGDRSAILSQAAELIAASIGPIRSRSEILETEPWGFDSDTKFMNQALLIETQKTPEEILNEILVIETKLGRIRNGSQWSSRIIDIDILCSEELMHHTDKLTIPHKHLHERPFALQPLCQLVPSWQHPILQKTYYQLLTELNQAEIEITKIR